MTEYFATSILEQEYIILKNKPNKTKEDKYLLQLMEKRFEGIPDELKKKLILPVDDKLIAEEFGVEIADYFADKNILFYRPVEDAVVKLKIIPIKNNNSIDKKVLGFHTLKPNEFVSLIEKFFDTGTEITIKGETFFKKKSVPVNVADIVLASSQFKSKLPVIEKIYTIPMPVLIDNKLIFPKKEYDLNMWSWLPPNAPEIKDMALEEAKEIIEQIFKEFCFKSQQDKINAIAGLITPYCRGLYKEPNARTPLMFYIANRERAGKDYCAGIAGIVYEDEVIEDSPIGEDEELRKKLTSVLKIGRMRYHSSNNIGFLNSAVLTQFITNKFVSDRFLGTNNMCQFPNMVEMSLSANTGITYTPDLSARSIFINFFLSLEDPNSRVFKNPDLHSWVKEHRSDVISALYSLIENWVDKGMPDGNVPFSSYPEWSRIVGGIMESAGYGSPCLPNEDKSSIGGDKETKDMKRLYELCFETWQDQPILKREIIDQITDENSDFNGLFSWLGWNSEKGDARAKFSHMLERFKGREFSGIILYSDDNPRASRRRYNFSKNERNATKEGKPIDLKDFVEGI